MSCSFKNKSAHEDKLDGRAAFYALTLALLAVAVYLNALHAGFVFDDDVQVVDNPWIKNARYIPDILSNDVWGYYGVRTNYYRPMMHLIYMSAYHIFGLDPRGFHLLNILLHAGVSALLFLIFLRINSRTFPSKRRYCILSSFAAVALFAVHPVHTEAVTWVAGLPEVSFSFFYILSLYLYISLPVDGEFISRGRYWGSVAAFFAAMLCKEPAITLPIVLIVYDFAVMKQNVLQTSYFKRLLPYLIMVFAYFALRVHALGSLAPNVTGVRMGGYEYAINAFRLFGEYALKFLFPVNLNAFHVFHPLRTALQAGSMLSLAFAALAWLEFKRRRAVFLGMALFVMPILPALYIPGIGKNVFAERYLYLPSAGAFLAFSLVMAATLVHRRKAAAFFAAFALATVAIYGLGTVRRNNVWRDDYTLWTDTAAKSPDSALPFTWLGGVYYARGDYESATANFKAALKIQPGEARALDGLGNIYSKSGDMGKAIDEYRTALMAEPYNAAFHSHIGVVYAKTGKLDMAVREFITAQALNPYYAPSYNNLGVAYRSMGRVEDARAQFEKAVGLNPENKPYRDNLAGNAAGR